MLHPILLDARPPYMSGDPTASLLLAPVGTQRLLSLIASSVAPAGHTPLVLSTFAPTARYEADIRRTCATVGTIGALADFRPTERFEASEWLLFIDPRYCLLNRTGVPAMLRDVFRSRSRAAHLVVMARHAGGTSERVELASDGRVRRIQRYYDSATWPFLNAVACSLVSAACLRKLADEAPCTSLTDLRSRLMLHGVPCRDVPIDGAVFDLGREDELVRLNERAVLDAFGNEEAPASRIGVGASVHATARLVGPVIVQDHGIVEAGAVVVGPAVIGEGARVGYGAVVALSVIAATTEVAPGAVVRSRAVFDGHSAPGETAAGTHDPAATAPPGSGLAVEHEERRALYPRAKALIEATLALVALVVLSPLLGLIALLIKLDSRGPVFFADLREGQHGRLFRCLKFRTMVTGSDRQQRELQMRNEVDGPQFKLEKDPRLTRVGRWLRPASFDELPQLLNVVKGEMSLIGPRPSPFRENQTCVPWRDARLSVRPGITGLWQVCRHDRREGDFHQWIYFDLLYVQHMSLAVDVKVLLATLLTRGGQTHVAVERIIPRAKLAP